MEQVRTPGLFIVAVMATYWAYAVVDGLLREFSESITYVDLAVIFVLGLIAGAAFTMALVLRRGPS